MSSNPSPIHEDLAPGLDPAARAWLDAALAEAADAGSSGESDNVAAAPAAVASWELRFAAAGRHCGQEHADSVRVLLLEQARAGLATLTRLYHQGTAAERRAVLLALPHRVTGPGALPLIEDALRTNDTRLVAAAVGPYAAAHLDSHGWRHAILKCLFTGVPVAAVDDLERRAHGDAELARMLADFAAERTAAGRPVPADLHHVHHLTGEES
ncbi:EboA domain-containing protein [Streptomyces lushanensis]|uniref:EboA domain-containing protein n=1 Tax=Streptomyces lushanensis TaxID=1434255 RepID=UPI000832070F|nr:EboA domain-containing protein [Streptomyces lushanensis]